MISKLKLPILISLFFSFSMSSYVYFSLKRERLMSTGRGMGYRFVDKYYTPDKVPGIFKTIFENNSSKIKKLLPEVTDSSKLQSWCEKATKVNWEADNGKILMHGLKWCSIPVHLALNRQTNKFDGEKFNKLFVDIIDQKAEVWIEKFFPSLSRKEKQQNDESKAKLLKGAVVGFCNETLNDAWTSYYESQQSAIDILCPESQTV